MLKLSRLIPSKTCFNLLLDFQSGPWVIRVNIESFHSSEDKFPLGAPQSQTSPPPQVSLSTDSGTTGFESVASAESKPSRNPSSHFKMKLKEYLAEQNVRPADVGKVLITFKLAAWSTWVLLVPFCGKLQPLRRLSRMSGPQRLKAAFIRRYPNKYEQWEEHVLRGSEWFAKRPTVRWIPDTFGQKHADFGLSIAEATVLYKVK